MSGHTLCRFCLIPHHHYQPLSAPVSVPLDAADVQPFINVLGSHIHEFLDLLDTPALGEMQRTEATGLRELAFLHSVPAPLTGLIGSMLRPPLRIVRDWLLRPRMSAAQPPESIVPVGGCAG